MTKTAFTFRTLELCRHIKVVEGGSDKLQRLVEGVGVTRAGVENVNPWGKRIFIEKRNILLKVTSTYRDVREQ